MAAASIDDIRESFRQLVTELQVGEERVIDRETAERFALNPVPYLIYPRPVGMPLLSDAALRGGLPFTFYGVLFALDPRGNAIAWKPSPAMGRLMQASHDLIERPEGAELVVDGLEPGQLVDEIVQGFWRFFRVVGWLNRFGIAMFTSEAGVTLKRLTPLAKVAS